YARPTARHVPYPRYAPSGHSRSECEAARTARPEYVTRCRQKSDRDRREPLCRRKRSAFFVSRKIAVADGSAEDCLLLTNPKIGEIEVSHLVTEILAHQLPVVGPYLTEHGRFS